jgi:hypothetical protein
MSPIRNENGKPDAPRRTAVVVVAGEDSIPDRTFEEIRRRFGDFYEQIVFLTVGLVDHEVMDAQGFEGSEVRTRVSTTARGAITSSLELARKAGMTAVACVAIGTDPVDEVERLAVELVRQCPQAMFFVGKLVFEHRRWYHGLLHRATAEEIQRRLERRGFPLTILPVVV